MLQPWIQGVITNIINETHNTKRFFIEVPSTENFQYEAGQFVTLDLPIHEQKNKRWRSYSIASAPDGSNVFELIIVLLENGAGTTWLWEHGKIGTELTMRGPQGKFTLPEVIDHDLYFICTGTGIAPFRSMVKYIHQHQIPHQEIYLIFGCRKYSDSLYFSELKQLESEMLGFHFLPTYSREPSDNPLLLRTGYVHAVYEEFVKHNALKNADENGPQLKPAKFYLCGWKNMIDDARSNIAILGYDRKAVHLELYG